MLLNQVFEFSMVLNEKKFHELLSKATVHSWDEESQEYTDCSFVDKGILIKYRDTQYKKKVSLTYNMNWKRMNELTDINKVVNNFDKMVRGYFKNKYSLQDFRLSGVVLVADVKMDQRCLVDEYLKVIRRIGKVKNFEVSEVEHIDKSQCFCLKGKSNGIQFMAYSLETVINEHFKKLKEDEKKIKTVVKDAKGIIRFEVRLDKSKAINSYIEATDTKGSIKELLVEQQNVFMGIIKQIIPYGDFYKKDKIMEILHNEVHDKVLRRKMMRLVTLIPEKKSLHVAQKSMFCKRDMNQIMEAFAEINLSPVTIGKRQDMKHLDNIYFYMRLCEEKSVNIDLL